MREIIFISLCLLIVCAEVHAHHTLPCEASIAETLSDPSTFCSNESLTCSEVHGDLCPPGLFCKEGHCQCGAHPDKIIRCYGTSSFVLKGYCATFDSNSSSISIGYCIYRTKHPGAGKAIMWYTELPVPSTM